MHRLQGQGVQGHDPRSSMSGLRSPAPVLDVYRLWRPAPLLPARRFEVALAETLPACVNAGLRGGRGAEPKR